MPIQLRSFKVQTPSDAVWTTWSGCRRFGRLRGSARHLSAIPLSLMPVVKSPPVPPLKISKRCAGRYPIFLYLCVEGTVTHYDKIPESSTAVYMSSMDKDTLITLLNRLLSSFFLMTAPNTAHVDVATNAVRAKLTADNER